VLCRLLLVAGLLLLKLVIQPGDHSFCNTEMPYLRGLRGISVNQNSALAGVFKYNTVKFYCTIFRLRSDLSEKRRASCRRRTHFGNSGVWKQHFFLRADMMEEDQ